ncbi:50S ribosomal protein L25/general stress protein Ctc [Microbacterium indicum]|uniref:50S ribosomal protein L25/general stress protein Ctc n=1 Tax=Microbacterium indicum TaxID=358100 RepID=UPI00048CE430|nr:50S ribosomal protein L25/general stress protein Ctc [Microbacterium indicum]
MSDNATLSVDVRTEFGKGFARRLRAAGKIPAVLYGHGTEPRHLALPGHEAGLIVRSANALIELDIEGQTELALVKDVQRDPVRQIIEHIDLVIVKRGERVQVAVPVVLEGETFSGTIHTQAATTITVDASATALPEHIVVSIAGLEDGALVHAGDVTLPEGVVLAEAKDMLLVSVSTPAVEAEEEAPAAAEATAESAE